MRPQIKSYQEIYYCKKCCTLYKSCYDMDEYLMCPKCFCDIDIIPEIKIKAFIRNKRLKQIYKNNNIK